MLSIVAAALAATLSATPSPEGLFASPDGKRALRIECSGGRCTGRLVEAQDAPDQVGKVVLEDLVPARGGGKGTLILPHRGREVPVLVSIPDSATLRMEAKAGPLSRSRDWKRVR